MRLFWGTALLLVSPAAASCQTDELAKAVLECAGIDSTDDRLNCFDSLARGVAKAGAPKPVASQAASAEGTAPGQWHVEVTNEPLDNTKSVAVGSYGKEHQAQIVLRCRQRQLGVLLGWNGRFLGATDPTVWTRIGTAKAEKKRWSLSGDHRWVLLQRDAREFVRALLSADQLVVQTEHFAQGRVTDVFDVSKLKDAIAPLEGECRIE